MTRARRVSPYAAAQRASAHQAGTPRWRRVSERLDPLEEAILFAIRRAAAERAKQRATSKARRHMRSVDFAS
jgi:hypothetical protein